MIRPSPFDRYGIEDSIVRLRNHLYVRLSPKDDPATEKIFVIGHPRTGTGTIHRILLANGIRARHSSGTWKTARYDAFSDRGNYQPFELLDRHYPNSIFVLNTRPVANYIHSRIKQTLKSHRNRRLPRPRFSTANIRNEILRRNAHFLACVRHFREQDNLVVVNIERPGAFDFLAEQLSLTHEQEIWHNRRTDPPDETTAGRVDAAFESLGASDHRQDPFIVPALLSDDERDEVAAFHARHHERIFL
jgi:hypothetical protein